MKMGWLPSRNVFLTILRKKSRKNFNFYVFPNSRFSLKTCEIVFLESFRNFWNDSIQKLRTRNQKKY